jgi:hypothetical protein
VHVPAVEHLLAELVVHEHLRVARPNGVSSKFEPGTDGIRDWAAGAGTL